MRVLTKQANNLSGSTNLYQKIIKKVLKSSLISWINGIQVLNNKEKQLYLVSFDNILQPEELLLQNTIDVLRDSINSLLEYNNTVYIYLISYKGLLNGKRKLNRTPALRTVVALYPVIPI
jgi:hypothetical protein